MAGSVVVVFLFALPLIFSELDFWNYKCQYDIYGNDTDPKNMDFYCHLEKLIKDLSIADDILSNISSTGGQLWFRISIYVDPNVRQIIFLPATLEMTFDIENNSESSIEVRESVTLQ